MPRTSGSFTPQRPSITKVPLNDDKQEKANRRHAQAKRNSMRASATPNRSRRSLLSQDSPHTPAVGQNIDMPDVTGSAVTPMKRPVPLLANFEEWIKLATDNKINANNAFNFALIDYFHDMSLLKEGDGVNFQKASCTLDGCVKIYTSRVDSINTDTSKLLSGLAESGNKKKRGGDAEGSGDEGDGEEGEEGEEGQNKKKRKRAARSAESTLAASFEQLQNKKMDLELAVDPLFKKASADFDEGGAKGLLLNHLAIDSNGRIVFDSSDDVKDATQPSRATPMPENMGEMEEDEDETERPSEDVVIDISMLAAKYFPDLSRLDEQDVCPSMKTFELGNPNGSIDLPFLKAPEPDKPEQPDEDIGGQPDIFSDGDIAPNFDDDDDDGIGFNLPPETGFGEGGEIWATNAARDPQARVFNMEGDGDEEGGEGGEGVDGAEDQPYNLAINHNPVQEQENILSYFDEALKKNWAGPEHWRIRRVKEIGKPATTTKRKEKEPFKIDFFSPMSQDLANALYTPAPSMASVMLPKSQWKSKTRNLAPDDKHFDSKQLLRLFLKPNIRLGARRNLRTYENRSSDSPLGENDAAQWAALQKEHEAAAAENVEGNYDADFYQDDGLPIVDAPMDDDGETFADARDHFSPPPEENQPPMSTVGTEEGAFGDQLVTQGRRARPVFLQYARKAKQVDVRRLKDELWKEIGFEDIAAPPPPDAIDDVASKAVDGSLKFTQVMKGIKPVYPQKALDDISTSYCFICLLHLANEKGLVIDRGENLEDLSIRKDFSADLSVGV